MPNIYGTLELINHVLNKCWNHVYVLIRKQDSNGVNCI